MSWTKWRVNVKGVSVFFIIRYRISNHFCFNPQKVIIWFKQSHSRAATYQAATTQWPSFETTSSPFYFFSTSGASPFSPSMAAAMPFAHLAHLPGAFSMLGHPAFPMSSLFGHLGDGNPLGIPSSLASSLNPSSGKGASWCVRTNTKLPNIVMISFW